MKLKQPYGEGGGVWVSATGTNLIGVDGTAPTISAISFAGKTGTGSGTNWTVDISDVADEALLDNGSITVSEASTLQSKTVDENDVSSWCNPVTLVAGENTGSIQELLGFAQPVTFDILKTQDADHDGYLTVVVELKDASNNTTSITINIKLDETAPSMVNLTAIIDGSSITGTTSITCEVGCTVSSIKVLLSEPVTVNGTPVVTMGGGSIPEGTPYGTISLDASDTTNKTLIITPYSGNEKSGLVGDFTFRVAAGAVKDAWGNENAETTFILHVHEKDTTAPEVSIMIVSYRNRVSTSAPITITSNENGTYTYTISDGTNSVTGTGSIIGDIDVNLNVDISGLSDGTITATATVTDAAGNVSETDEDTAQKDTVAPTVTGISVTKQTISDSNLTQSISIFYNEFPKTSFGPSVTFSDGTWSPVGGIWGSDRVAQGGVWVYIYHWDQSFTLTDQDEEINDVTISVSGAQDEAGNVQVAYTSSALFNIDTKAPDAPTVSGLPSALPIIVDADNISFTVTAEANSLIKIYRGGSVVESYQLSGGATYHNFSVSLLQDTVNEFTVTATDANGNESPATTLPDITEDSTAPSVIISSTASSPTKVSPIPITVTFSEPVTGFELADVTVGNGNAGNFAGSGTTYTFDVTPTADGAVTVDIAADKAIDAASNGNTAADQFTITYDTTLTYTFTVGPTGGDYTTIQAAVDAASAGDIINVAAGTYNEQVVIDKSLTLQGAGDSTIIKPSTLTTYITGAKEAESTVTTGIIIANGAGNVTVKNLKVDASSLPTNRSTWFSPSVDKMKFAGVFYYNTGGVIDGVTSTNNNHITIPSEAASTWGRQVQSFKIDADTTTSVNVELKNSTASNFLGEGVCVGWNANHITVNIHDNTITGDGSLTTRRQNGIQVSYATVTGISHNTISNLVYRPGNPNWATGIMVKSVPSGAVIEGNTISNCDFGIIDTFSSGVSILDNDITGSGHNYGTGIYLDNGNADLTGIIVDGNTIGSGFPYGGICLRGWYAGSKTISETISNNVLDGGGSEGYGIFDYSGAAGAITATITGNTITEWDTGISIASGAPVSGFTIHFNNIYGNTSYGINNGGTGILDATSNWWGDVSGPSGGATDPEANNMPASGTGDKVSNNVHFVPWLDAPYPEGNLIYFTSITGPIEINNNILDDKAHTNTEIVVTGTATTTVAKYSDNPGSGFSGDIGKYIDVHIATSTGVTELEIRLYYTDTEISGKDESTLKMYWWNGANWSPCSDTGVNTDLNYIWAKIRNDTDTTPNLSQLTGTPFAGSGKSYTGGGGGGGDFTAPLISEINVIPYSNKAIITWKTNEPSISWVAYGATSDYGTEFQNSDYLTSHSVTLNYLSPKTTYHYQIKSKDSAGNIGKSADATFTTLSEGEVKGATSEGEVKGITTEKPISEMTPAELEAKIAEIQTKIYELQAAILQLLNQSKTYSGIPAEFKFERTLSSRMTGDDVKYLQIILNSDPETRLALSGAGSPGNETTYFGPLTQAAVIKFQEKYASEILAPWNLTKGTGLVGSTTRAKLNQMLGR